MGNLTRFLAFYHPVSIQISGFCSPASSPISAKAATALRIDARQVVTAQIDAQVERFAPSFRERILARHTRGAAAMELHNPNYVGGGVHGMCGYQAARAPLRGLPKRAYSAAQDSKQMSPL